MHPPGPGRHHRRVPLHEDVRGEVVPGVAVDGVQVGQEVPQPECDRVRAQQQGGRRLGDGVSQDEFQGMHVARSCKTDRVYLLQ